REYGFHTSMIEASMMINDRMPEYVAERASKILNRFKKSVNGSNILILGVAYKQDIDDYRESPALEVIDELEKLNANIQYYDPYILEYKYKGKSRTGLLKLDIEILSKFDLVIVTAAHTNIEYSFIQEHCNFVFDTKNAMKSIKNRENIELL
ncbi:MAG: UDP binding domain-containing protein, partial [Acholeplasma sp.]|nr:UDP binding domain-containing protein [Acholeplasma sp.]